MPYRMFTSSANFFKEFTDLNDFAQVCAASVWTMRWQVKGYFAEVGFYESPTRRPSEAELRSRFLTGSGVASANFRSLVDGRSWDEQRALLAQVTLLGMVSLYEGWCSSFAYEAGLSKAKLEGLQWPSSAVYERRTNKGVLKPGIGEVMALNPANQSAIMAACFQPGYAASRQNAPETIDTLLLLYRYWREIRNALTHSAGIAGPLQLAAQTLIAPINPTDLGMQRIPRLDSYSAGARLDIDYREVLQFGEVLQRIVTAVDVALSGSKRAEARMLDRWERRRSVNPVATPSSSTPKRRSQLRLWMTQAGMIAPRALDELDAFLTARYGIDLRTPVQASGLSD